MKRLIVLAALVLVVPRADAATATMEDLLAGQPAPLSLTLKDLTPDWRRFTVGSSADPVGVTRLYAGMLGGSSATGVYYSRGQTVVIEGEPFLVAYRQVTKPIDIMAMMRGGMRPDQMPRHEPPTADTPLALSLLGLRTIGSLNDIRPFELEVELAGGDDSPEARARARDQAAEAAGLGDLRKLGLALLMYAEDGNKTLPPMKDAAAVAKALQPYGAPAGAATYLPNPALSGKKVADFKDVAKTITFYEAKSVDGERGVLFLDGHVERVSEARWAVLKKAAGIR